MQITSAMKMVSAAKLKHKMRLQQCALCRKINGIITKLSATLEGDAGGEFTTQREIKKVLVVAITSNRVLWCFNSNVIKESKAF
jgi:F-type H+-transporting ATPase subunit gamma